MANAVQISLLTIIHKLDLGFEGQGCVQSSLPQSLSAGLAIEEEASCLPSL